MLRNLFTLCLVTGLGLGLAACDEWCSTSDTAGDAASNGDAPACCPADDAGADTADTADTSGADTSAAALADEVLDGSGDTDCGFDLACSEKTDSEKADCDKADWPAGSDCGMEADCAMKSDGEFECPKAAAKDESPQD